MRLLPSSGTLSLAPVGVRQKNGKDEQGTRNMLSQWKSRGYIEDLADGKYKRIKAS